MEEGGRITLEPRKGDPFYIDDLIDLFFKKINPIKLNLEKYIIKFTKMYARFIMRTYLSIIGVLLVFSLVFATGCTTTPQPAADENQTTPVETTEVPQTTAATNATGPVANMTDPAIATTAPTPAQTTEPAVSPTPAPQPEVIIDEGTAVYAGGYKVYDLCKEEGVEFQQPGDHYTIEIRAENLLNILILKSEDNVGHCEDHGPTWDHEEREWDYGTADPVFQYDEVTKKTLEYTVEKVGKYYLFLDGRIMPDDVTVVGDSSTIDIKVTKGAGAESL